MKRLLGVAQIGLVASLVLGAAHAADMGDPIADRQTIMKNVGAGMKAAGQMVKGETEYDAAKAELAMRVINAAAIGYGHFFPEDSKTGGDTEAKPTIWEDMDGFQQAREKLVTTSAAAVKASEGGLDSFKAAFGEVGGACKGCHEKYRVKKEQ